MAQLVKMPAAADFDEVIDLDQVVLGTVSQTPYPFLVAHNVIPRELIPLFRRDFPAIKRPGFLPIDSVERRGIFDRLVRQLEGPELAAVLSYKLNVDLVAKPKIITVRKWSEREAGRIHVDGPSKIVTSLIYLNETWPENEDGGRFRVLNSPDSFDDCAAEVLPMFGTFVAFVRSDDSWHGHKPFVGERRVVQTAWLKSEADLKRKQQRGKLALMLKNLLGRTAGK